MSTNDEMPLLSNSLNIFYKEMYIEFVCGCCGLKGLIKFMHLRLGDE